MAARRLLMMVVVVCLWASPLAQKVKLNGYTEFREGTTIIVEGQRVTAHGRTKLKGKRIRIKSLRDIPFGFETRVTGRRQSDGSIRADKVEAKPNGMQMYESDVLQATDQIEKMWVEAGEMYYPTQDGGKKVIGKIQESGPRVRRVRGIMRKLLPPYIPFEDVRVRVVVTEEWNASAMGNGAIWVYSGLMEEMSDQELAIILGHELAHFTHEHSRKGAKQRMWGQLAAVAGAVGSNVAGGAAGSLAGMGGALGLSAWTSGYSRGMEDQADRVGLRYAYEGGFDVERGPSLWEKFREKYGESDSVSNFFFGSHSRPSDRIENIEKELDLNYR